MKLPIEVSESSKEPIYHQIETQLKSLIVSGQLAPGTMLPSIRKLASDLSCSVITTRRAYQNLENSGFIKTIQGKGTFVSHIGEQEMDDTRREVAYAILQRAVKDLRKLDIPAEEAQQMFAMALREEEKGEE